MIPENFRSTNRALIVEDNKLLLIRILDDGHEYYIFPGGKQEFGETSTETVIRECHEELGCLVEVKECLLIREFIGQRRENPFPSVSKSHIKELYFFCQLKENLDLKIREPEQKEIAWIPLDLLSQKDIRPMFIKDNIKLILNQRNKGAIYVGDVD